MSEMSNIDKAKEYIDSYKLMNLVAPLSILLNSNGVTLETRLDYRINLKRKVEIPDFVDILDYCVFGWCVEIERLILHEGLKTIGSYSLSNCLNLVELRIPNSVKDIGHRAFYHCDLLKSIVIPKDAEFIGVELFEGCHNLRELTLPRRFETKVTKLGLNSKVVVKFN